MASVFVCVLVASSLVYLTAAQYSIDLQLSAQEELAGSHVTVTCDVTNQPNTSFTLVWVRRRPRDGSSTRPTSPSPSSRAEDEETIGSNSHLEEHFLSTGRYSAKYEIVKKLTRVKFILTITDLKSIDSGEIGCRIPIAKLDAFRQFTVLVPVQSVRLMSSNSVATHAQSYVDGELITFVDGETRRLSCRVNGSHPAPDVRILIGDDDVTAQFSKNTELIRTGPINNSALQESYYVTELFQSAMNIGFEISGKSIRCVADVPGSNFSSFSSHIIANFNSYKPKFVNCTGPLVPVSLYQTGVRLSCHLHALPPITDVKVRWTPRQARPDHMVTLGAGKREGHHHVLVEPDTSNEHLKTVSLLIDKIFPQHIVKYTFIAENADGISETEMQLVQREGVTSTASSSRSSVLITSTILAISARFIGLVRF